MSGSRTLTAIKANLAKNIAAARVARADEPLSQQELADLAGVSRAMVVQLESAKGNPSLSKLVDLAEALGVPPFLLLLGPLEMNAIAEATSSEVARQVAKHVSSDEFESVQRDLASGVPKLRSDAISDAATTLSSAGISAGAVTAAGIGTAIMPGVGTVIGAAIGTWLGSKPKVRTKDNQ